MEDRKLKMKSGRWAVFFFPTSILPILSHLSFFIILFFLEASPQSVSAEEFAPLFPFVVSYDSPQNVTNLSGKLDAPAGNHGFVRVENGKLVTEAGPIRFWGTNLCFNANFPSQEQADHLAERLARFGFNCVRLHHMDTGNNSLVTGKKDSFTEIDPVKLDALDKLVAALKKRGIYVDINLHVGRMFDERDGFPHKETRPEFDKGVGNFEPRMIEQQMNYARDLLTHVNPYTKLSYTDDPCVAIVEISNEDSVVSAWSGGQMNALAEPYRGVFRKLWNGWLREKYPSDEALRTAWNCHNTELGEEMLPGGDFSTDEAILSQKLQLQTDEQSKAELWIDNGSLKIKVVKKGKESWIPQLHFLNGSLKKGAPYTMSLRIRTNKETKVQTGILMDHDPWDSLGAMVTYTLTPEWQTFTLSFHANANDDKTRFSLSSLEPDVIYEIDEISLRPGGSFGPSPDQTLENGSIPLVVAGQNDSLPGMYRDFYEFLIDLEKSYWCGMYDFLKNELNVQSPVIGTQLNYGSTHVQAKLDFCDNHNYWNHPVFTEKAWDINHWYVTNRALVNHIDDGTLTRLAATKVGGMPYTVTEYDHPFPNQYGAEGNPMLAAFARFQKWSGIFPFAYTHSLDLKPDRVTSFFDMLGNPGKLVHAPACYAMFARGDVAEAKQTYSLGMSPTKELDTICEYRSPWMTRWKGLGGNERLALIHEIAIDLQGKTTPNIPVISKDQKVFTSDTGEIVYDTSKPDAGTMTVTTTNSRLFTGFVPEEKPVKLGNVTLEIGKTRLGWCTVSLVTMEGTGLGEDGKPARLLLAATGDFRNTGMNLEQLPENRITLGSNFGKGPVLCEGIPARVTLPVDAKRLHLFALTPSGDRHMEIPVEPTQETNQSTFTIGPEFQTLWYEISVEDKK